MRRLKQHDATLLCWHSRNHGHEVLTGTVGLLGQEGVHIRRVLYLHEPGDQIPEVPGVELTSLRMPIKDPTHHRPIYEAIQEMVLPLVRPLRELHLNISPGTPAMHAVWLVMHAGGAFPEGTRVWSSQIDKRTGQRRLDAVDFPITTYLQEVRRVARAEPGRAQYDPQARSPLRRGALELLQRYAQIRRATVLILGERGTGKSRLVETLFAIAKGRENVVVVPCGTLDRNLADSLLFGHVKGAFTDAKHDRPGYFGDAAGGILFLDEIQDLPKETQRKLVRVLQDSHRRYRPVGASKETEADVEIVCASHLPLAGLCKELDADLFDRLSLLMVEVPPLRRCREDVQGDFEQVWRELHAQQDVPAEPPWGAALEKALQESELRGNFRDMQRLALLLMVHQPDGQKALAEWRRQQARLLAAERPADRSSFEGKTWDKVLSELARWALDFYGSEAAAAGALQKTEKTIRKHARRHGAE